MLFLEIFHFIKNLNLFILVFYLQLLRVTNNFLNSTIANESFLKVHFFVCNTSESAFK